MGCDGALILRLLDEMESRLMSEFSDKLAEVHSAFDAALARVQEDVDAINAKVDELQAKVDAGTASPEDLASLDALKARIDALDPTKPATIPDEGEGEGEGEGDPLVRATGPASAKGTRTRKKK